MTGYDAQGNFLPPQRLVDEIERLTAENAKLRATQIALDQIRPHIRAIERILSDHDYKARAALNEEMK